MTVFCLRAVQLLGLILALSTFALPNVSYGKNKCFALYSTPQLSQLKSELENHFNGQGDYQLWDRYFQSIKNPGQFREFLSFVGRFHDREFFVTSWGYTRVILGEELTVSRLAASDWAKPLIDLRRKMTDPEKQGLLSQFQKVRRQLHSENVSSLNQWQHLEVILKLALFPESIESYLHEIPHDKRLIYDHSIFFSRAAQSALESLAGVQLTRAQRKISELLVEAYKDASEDGKEYRRNVETIHHVLNKEKFNAFIQKLKLASEISVSEVMNVVDSYWVGSLVGFKTADRSTYSFKFVFEVAESIQKDLGSLIGNSHLDVYGSFANGKAQLSTSDVDIHPGSGMMTKYIEVFTTRGRNYADLNATPRYSHEALPDFAKAWSNKLTRAEQNIAKLLKRQSYVLSELMTIVPVSPGFSSEVLFKPSVAQFYNPIVIRIYKDGIELRVYDSFEKNMISIKLR